MKQEKEFYERYWKDEHIKVNPFDRHPQGWTDDNFAYHFDFFKPYVRGELLDFGCGEGDFAHRIRAHCAGVCGIDVSGRAIAAARERFPDMRFTVADEGRLPYPDHSFDTVCALDVLEHILDVETALEELRRVTRPGGNLLIATSELTRLKTVIIALTALDDYFYPAGPHIRHFTRKNLANILLRKKFCPVAYKKNRTYFGFIPQGQLVVATAVAAEA